MGKKRTKAIRSIRTKQSTGQEEEYKKAPHSFVFQRGHVGKNVLQLVKDMRQLMEPYTASRLQVRKKNVLKDFVNIAGELGVSHFLIYTKSDINVHLRMCRLPRGPTLTFRVHEYTLCKDIVSALKKPNMDPKQFNHHPLLVMNNFTGEEMHLKLMSTMFQNMFPSININKVNLNNIKRCVMINYNSEDKTIDFRHYNVKVVPVGLSRGVKKLIKAEVPDLSRFNDVSDFITKGGNLSESEAELDGDHNEVVLPQDIRSRGNIRSAKSAIRLTEVGPRMTLQLLKIEDGVCQGDVMFHELVHKSDKDIKDIKALRESKRKLKELRKRQQEENVSKKLQIKEEHKQKSLKGMRKEEGDVEEPEMGGNEDDDEDDDDIFKLKIKPIPADPNKPKVPTDFGPVPMLKPPPKIPKSPQPPRVNPFDRDSPPEEDFAKFEIMHEKKEEEEATMPEQSVSFSTTISTTGSVTPEEEQNLEPLEPFYVEEVKDGWKLMLRQPTKKKLTTNRFWKGVIVRLVKTEEGPVIKVFSEKDNGECYHELPLQPCYSVSDVAQQHYDQYGKIYTLKIQYIFYRERVGIKTDRITPSFVKKPKATMILDHAPQVSEMMKLGSLDRNEIKSFGRAIENALMHLDAHREKTLTYVKEEVCAEVVDEYEAELDKAGVLQKQKARVRVFFLAFVTGMPTCEVGLNDRRRDGKEVVGRYDIIPIKTEEWIKLEDVEFHCCVDLKEYEKTNNIKFHPLDACHFEVMRYRVRLRQNKELPLQLKIQQTLSEKKCEIRCDLLVTGYHSFSKKHGQFPCEDIEVHFPIPEQWIYLFRYEKRFRYGAFKSSTRKPGKIKGLERLTMIAQGLLTPTLMEADVGSAKYEHLNRAVVWRIPRLPERNEGAYTSHLFKLTLEFGAHDEVPESFEQFTTVDFTMPSCTVSKSQVRSISVENPTPPEKWVKYLAKYHYRIEIDHRDERAQSAKMATKESPASDSE